MEFEYGASWRDEADLAASRSQVFRNALPPNPPNMTLTVSDTYGFGDGNLAAGRMRVALFGSLERVTDAEESKKCRKAYLAGRSELFLLSTDIGLP